MEPTHARSHLSRELGLWSAMTLVFGVVIGSAIFRVPSPIAADAGSATGVLIVWIAGGVITLFGALSLVELAAMYPQAGGIYVYLREAFGRPLAFVYGWTSLVAAPMSTAAVALIFAEYLGFFLPLTALTRHLVAAAMVVLVAAANYRSVKFAAFIQSLSAGTKLLAILGISVVIFALAPHGLSPALPARVSAAHGWLGIGAGLLVVLWAYQGWTSLTPLSGEVRNPQRNLPLALIGGVGIVIAAYLMINLAYMRALPLPQLAASRSVAADAVAAVLGRAASSLVGALVLVSVLGTLNGAIFSGPRVFYAMAEDGLFFRIVGKIHPRYGTPHVAVLIVTIMTAGYALSLDFVALAEGAVLAVWPFLALCVIGLFVLRRKRPHVKRGYRAWGYPVVPALFALATFAIIVNALYAQFRSTVTSVAIMLAGVPLYFLWLWWQRHGGARHRRADSAGVDRET